MTLQTRLNLHADFTRQRSLEFAPRVGYNFKERQVYWHLPLRLNVLPRHDGCFTLEASGGDHIYNARQADEVRQRLHGITNYDSLTKVFDTYDFLITATTVFWPPLPSRPSSACVSVRAGVSTAATSCNGTKWRRPMAWHAR